MSKAEELAKWIEEDMSCAGDAEIAAELRRLQAENDALRKDAERYRWLSKQHWSDNKIGVLIRPKDNARIGSLLPSNSLLDSTVDRMIDEDLKGKP